MEYSLIHLETVNSTNSYSRQLLQEDNVKENTVIISDYQVAGKGQGSNHWQSEPMKNLLFSWILFPAFLAVSDQFMLSKMVSLGICDAMEDYALSAEIKWPNDIICNHRKLGGILIENMVQGSRLTNCIIGIGLNVNQPVFPDFQFPATSLVNECGREFEIEALFHSIMERLLFRYEQLQNADFTLLDNQYLERLYKMDALSRFESGGRIFQGWVRGINKFGELIIEESGETSSYGFHTIKMLSQFD